MIENQIDFLHICETNEQDANLNSSQSKAHIKYVAPIPNNFSNIFYIINNPDRVTTGSGSAIIVSENLYKHLEKTKILVQGRYIFMTFNFKNKTKLHIN